MAYIQKTQQEKKQEIENMFSEVESKVNDYFRSPEDIKELLDFKNKYYEYSFNNSILIDSQFKGGQAVGSFKFWNDNGFHVNKGEKGIKILVRCQGSDYFKNKEGNKIPVRQATEEQKNKIKNGEIETCPGAIYYKSGNVFDISQTNATIQDIPKLFPNRWLEGDIKDYKLFYKGMENIAKELGVKIIEPHKELGASKGVSYTMEKAVALNPRNSELQNVKTLLHELAHATLHTKENFGEHERYEKEFQAELTAYVICSHFKIDTSDTSDYSIKYLHCWTEDKNVFEKQKLLNEVRDTSMKFIDILEADELLRSRSKSKEFQEVKEEIIDKSLVKQIDRTKNQIHIFQNKENNKCFFGEKTESGVIKKSSNMDLKEARELFKSISEHKAEKSMDVLEI